MTARLVLLTVLAGCARNVESRADTLRSALLERDRPLLERDSARVAAKYARMSRSTFAFFRGVSWMLPAEPSRLAVEVALVGDPHLENVGTFLAGNGARVVDFNDFDLAGHGPFTHDLRRLGLGLWIVADMADLGRKQRARVLDALLAGYTNEIAALGRGEAGVSLRVDSAFGGDLADILVRGGDDDEDDRTGAVSVSEAERKLVNELLAQYPSSLHDPGRYAPAMFAPKRIVGRAMGVGSFPHLRYRVAVEGPGPDESDDWVLELKESRGRPAKVLVAIQRQVQEFPDDDPLLGWAAADGQEFRVRHATPEQRRLSAERLAKLVKSPRWGKRDLRDLAHDLGRLLARGHARAAGPDGKPGLTALRRLGDGRALRDETLDFISRNAARLEADLDTFRDLLARRGPLLGWTSAR